MKKRANNEGSIRKRSNGTWEARVTVDGKQKSIYGKTKTEVSAKMVKCINEVNIGTYIDETNATVGEWIDEWFEKWTPNIKPSTRRKYESIIRVHLKPHIGNIKMKFLTTAKVQRMYNDIVRMGKSPKTIKCIQGVLGEALQCAVSCDLIQKNVSERCVLPNSIRKEMKPLTVDQVAEFLSKTEEHRFHDEFFFTIFTGLRLAEVIGLTWDCVNFEDGTIYVYRQLSRLGKFGDKDTTHQFEPLKNNRARLIQPAPQVMNMLKERRAISISEFVFSNDDGDFINERTLYKNFKKQMKDMGISDARFHDLRHTYATLSLQNGTDIKTISSELGHATVAFTLDRYGHVSKEMMKQASDKMGELISGL